MKTRSFTKKTFEVYDDRHMVVYYNETEVEVPAATEGGQPQMAYEYDMVFAEAQGFDKGAFVDAIIRSKYSVSDEMAIQRHYANSKTTYKEEWQEYNSWCEQAKAWIPAMQPVE